MSSSRRCIVICQMFYPELISTGKSMTELCEALVAQGLAVEVWCGPLTLVDRSTVLPREMTHNSISIRRVWGTRFSKLSFWGKLLNHLSFSLSIFARLLFTSPKNAVILTLTNPPFLAGIPAFFSRFKGIPFVYKVADVYPETAISLGVIREKGLVARLWRRWNRYIFSRASAIIVLGRCMADRLRPLLLSEEADRLHICHVWSDDQAIQPERKTESGVDFRKKWELGDRLVLLYSGNMGRFHDMETILEAARVLRDQLDLVFVFVGEGYKKADCVAYANTHQLSNCRFETYVDREVFPDLLGSADVGLVSLMAGQEGYSVPSKTFGLMAAGLPVLGVLPEASEIALMLNEEACGRTVLPGDVAGLVEAILSLRDDADGRRALGQRGAVAVKRRYNVSHAAAQFKTIIEAAS